MRDRQSARLKLFFHLVLRDLVRLRTLDTLGLRQLSHVFWLRSKQVRISVELLLLEGLAADLVLEDSLRLLSCGPTREERIEPFPGSVRFIIA